MSLFSILFLVFVIVTAFFYYRLPSTCQWVVLLVASLVFYLINSGWLVFVLVGTSLVTFLIANGIEEILTAEPLKSQKDQVQQDRQAHKRITKQHARRYLTMGILVDLIPLLLLKYSNFFISTINILLRREFLPTFRFLLPLGISFYTLQAISYLADVYRGKQRADRNFARFLLYMSFFPQIVQGPIPRHGMLADQLYAKHSYDYRRITHGAQLILWGWIKKLVIADRLAIPVDFVFNYYWNNHGFVIFFGALLYSIQIYADFSGGMDIASGVAEIFGISLTENFRQPYFSRSVEEFWRRWHITLGAWMRDYVFYPLSLSKSFTRLGKKSRKILGPYVGKRLPAFLAMFIVYFLVGFWHGADWKYIVYGVWNGAIIASSLLLGDTYGKMRNHLHIPEDDRVWRAFQSGRTFLLCSFGRFFSRAISLKAAFVMIRQTFTGFWDIPSSWWGTEGFLGLSNWNWLVVIISIGVLIWTDCVHEKGTRIREKISEYNIAIRWMIYVSATMTVVIFGMYGPAYSAASFIYAQF